MILKEEKSICKINQKIIVSEENKRKHIANNIDENRVFQFRIDGDIIPKSTSMKRCDYLVKNEEKKDLYFIELKGTDVKKAIDQITDTIDYLKNEINGYSILPRIIYRPNSHGVHDTKVREFQRKYPRSIIATNIYEEEI